jgi:hypothetical protein
MKEPTQPPSEERRTNDSTPERDDGVDATLIRWMLSLTPEQRLDVLQSAVRSSGDLRDAAARG